MPRNNLNREERSNAELASESKIIYPLMESAFQLWSSKTISSADIVGSFIIAVINHIVPEGYCYLLFRFCFFKGLRLS